VRPPPATSRLSPPAAAGAGGRWILIVDDDADLGEEVASFLSDEGFVTEVAANGGLAIARLHEGMRPDLILLDLMMPVMDGWQFRAFQRADPDLAQLPVIAMSANDTAQARAIHADAYVSKPFSLSDLLSVVQRVLLEQQCQRLQQRLREVEQFVVLGTMAAGIGHEINNPLTYILGGLDELEHELPSGAPSRSRSLLSEIRYGLRRIQSVVSGLRACTMTREEEPREIHLGRLIESSLAIAAHAIRPRAHVRMAIEAAPIIVGSEARLGQVLINLLVNAAQSFDGGTPETNEIRVHAQADGDKAIIEVSDNGRGFVEAMRTKLFEPFFTTKPPGEGMGLGLTISRDIALEHGGSLQAENNTRGGATFRLVLPRRRRQ
jgi:C4-dicarboxylate-specific signal transduction histidine kinase